MTLGEKLAKTLERLEQAKIKGLEAQAAANMEAVLRARQETEEWLEGIRTNFVAQIEKNRVPLKKVTNYNKQAWLRDAQKGTCPNYDLWSNFKLFWAKEGLEPVIEEGHDGMGMESWINLSLKVLPERPRIDPFYQG